MSTATQSQSETQEQMIARLLAENAALKAANPPRKERFSLGHGLSCAVGEKGGISIYGLNKKFPVTLYAEQMTKLISVVPQLQAFIDANRSKLAVKPTIVK